MSIATLRLIVGIFFLVACGLLVSRNWLAPQWAARFDPLRLNLGAAFALVFGLLNLTRWYLAWSYRRQMATPVRRPLQPDPSLVPPEPPPQELQFDLQADTSRPHDLHGESNGPPPRTTDAEKG